MRPSAQASPMSGVIVAASGALGFWQERTAITVALPYSPLAGPLGLAAVPPGILAALVGLTVLYVVANEAAKHRYPPSDAAATPGARG